MIKKNDILMTKSSKTELVIKSYKCSQLVLPKCAGHLTVTNKRVIFHGVGTKSRLDEFTQYMKNSFSMKKEPIIRSCRIVKEVDVNTISGVSSYYGHNTNILLMIMAVIFGVIAPIAVSVAMFKGLYGKLTPTLLLIILILLVAAIFVAVGIAFLIFSRRPVFYLQIYSSQSNSAAISVGEGIGNFGGTKPLYALIGRPTEETDFMMRELGAIISDIKELGDNAVELWFRRVTKSAYDKSPPTLLDDTEEYLARAAKRGK